MRKLALSLSLTTLIVLASVPADADPITYTTRAAFDAAAGTLITETFEEGRVAAFGIEACSSPLDATTSNACFAAGDIVPGLQLTNGPVERSTGLALTGAGFGAGSFPGGGVDSRAIFANFGADYLNLNFSAGTNAVGLDVYSLTAAAANVTVYSRTGVLVNFAISTTDTGAGTFFGITSTEQILLITLASPGFGTEGVDNVSFGATVTPVPEPASMLLVGTGLLGAGVRRWRQKHA